MPSFNALTVSHQFLASYVKPGAFCIDATAGRGKDTAYLCNLVGKNGRVLAFDIQQEAVDSTRTLLKNEGLADIGEVILDSHSNMKQYAEAGTVDAIVFNFGWLPGGDHGIFTHAETSIQAIEQGLELLKPTGVMSLCIYYGRNNGTDERDALIRYLASLDSREVTVFMGQFLNRKNDPAIPVFLLKGI